MSKVLVNLKSIKPEAPMRRIKKYLSNETNVDMTPMLDIVFIMLIFFIVTTSFVKESGVVLDRPQSSKGENSVIPITLQIDDNSIITLDGRDISIDSVRANIETARAKDPKAGVIVKAHEKSKVGIVVSAFDQAKQAGADRVIVEKLR